jgi:cytochrome c oxidase assembly protein subunit 15
MQNSLPTAGRRDPADVLTFGFGATVAMWTVGYFGRLPDSVRADGQAAFVPPWLLFALLAAVLLVSGALAAGARLPIRRIAAAGLLSGALNLLIIGSVISRDTPKEMLRVAALWAPASILLTAAVFCAGAMVRGLNRRPPDHDVDPLRWRYRFALVCIAATMTLLAAGGAVTGMKAGLAVPDWPNSYGYNMFLYPLAKMTGGIYLEHAHRLLGSLVGLVTLILAIYLQKHEPRRWLRALAWASLVMVCVQGLMGGLRVTGTLTLSQNRDEIRPFDTLAIVHGVFAQVFFSTLVAIAVFQTRAWRTADAGMVAAAAADPAADRKNRPTDSDVALSIGLSALILIQIVLGALFRHAETQLGLFLHLGVAFVVMILAGWVGMRAWARPDSVPVLPKAGERLVIVMLAQLLLGGLALLGVMLTRREGRPVPLEVIFTTAHQTVGAILLAASVVVMLWNARLAGAAPAPQPVTTSAAASHV